MFSRKKKMRDEKDSWPIMIVSNLFAGNRDESYRLVQLAKRLEKNHDCRVVECPSYEEARDTFLSRADIGAVIIDWDMKIGNGDYSPHELLDAIRGKNQNIPVFLLTSLVKAENLDAEILNKLTGTLWKTSDTVEFLAGNVEKHLTSYIDTLYSPFFGALVKYAEEYKYAWHTPGHMGGTGFLRTPSGAAFFKFFGENMLRNDLSISVPELGSLLDHSGITGDAERNSARVFGADQTYYVLNGTSNVNQIIWRSQVSKDDIALADRNCHKSIYYAMVNTDAYPIYMVPRRNKAGIIGPVRLSEFSQDSVKRKLKCDSLIAKKSKSKCVQIMSMTNSTYDGICYNVLKIKEALAKSVKNIHFDEAWFAYARFFPIYKDFYGMTDDQFGKRHPPVFVAQSTHKLLTAFSQSSMLHIKNGGNAKINPAEFNMMHSSTSPQYNMVASLDVATQMMDEAGEQVWRETVTLAVELRKGITRVRNELESKKDWFFGVWQPETVTVDGEELRFEDVDTEYLANNREPWVLSASDNWHGFADIEDGYAMLDPIKLTVTTPGFGVAGEIPQFGIPAAVVTNFLAEQGIVCEKTDYYSFLMLNSLGTNRAKQESLLMALMKFKKLYDINAPLRDVFPKLAAKSPQSYGKIGLREHCEQMHNFIRSNNMLDKMRRAFETLPDKHMKPSQAFDALVKKNVEFVPLSEMYGRVPAVMIVPYPPGIPIMMGGEIMNENAKAVFDYLRLCEVFENTFAGYEREIHGIERFPKRCKKYFKVLCLKD